MNTLEKYNHIFAEVFGIPESNVNDKLDKQSMPDWDSVHQLNLVSMVEDTFDIMLEPEDIMGFTSYNKGLEILKSQGVEI